MQTGIWAVLSCSTPNALVRGCRANFSTIATLRAEFAQGSRSVRRVTPGWTTRTRANPSLMREKTVTTNRAFGALQQGTQPRFVAVTASRTADALALAENAKVGAVIAMRTCCATAAVVSAVGTREAEGALVARSTSLGHVAAQRTFRALIGQTGTPSSNAAFFTLIIFQLFTRFAFI